MSEDKGRIAKYCKFSLNENLDRLPRERFLTSFFIQKGNFGQQKCYWLFWPRVWEDVVLTSRHLNSSNQKFLHFNVLTQLLSELFSFEVGTYNVGGVGAIPSGPTPDCKHPSSNNQVANLITIA